MNRIDERCFGLLAADVDQEPGLKLVIKINALDDPSRVKLLNVDFVMEEFALEYCNEIFSNVYNVLMEYKSLFLLGSIHPAPSKRSL